MKGKPKLHILCELKLYIMNMKLIGRADLLSRTDPIGWLDLVTYCFIEIGRCASFYTAESSFIFVFSFLITIS